MRRAAEDDEVCGLRLVAKPSAAAASEKGPKVKFRIELWLRSSSSHVAESYRAKMLNAMSEGTSTNRKDVPDFEWKLHKSNKGV